MHLPVTVKELQTGYLISSYFKDLYLYLVQNKLPNTNSAIQKVGKEHKDIYSLLFKLITTPEKETPLLAIPEVCIDKL